MSTDNRHHFLHPRTRFALARVMRAVGEWLFDGLAWTSAACHLANSLGFVADEELVQRYLALPGRPDETAPPRTSHTDGLGQRK
ncbi:hypothetical protein AAGS40_25795 (plasmid) [Paraburkholderia sp. PREW-6R]|uniref:hypothetical protein n=1 Tax=Paraburkholderia sp. PREW-6R TaxID=3141544 RepID=UPI0031F52A29